ncbi:hypothetical protein [Mesorhizobium sp. SP-1A]|uniref:hypothetical protein n=1 Tax=Mesorhizobium sp. SP-1A TaxID=3077840 RepID=UPI0028F73E96|nr:hypothetical protein [Mesorhizobium sp. SP-1A]
MQRNEASAGRKSGEKLVRACPVSVLKQPVRKFEDTFSAENVVLEKFFSRNR